MAWGGAGPKNRPALRPPLRGHYLSGYHGRMRKSPSFLLAVLPLIVLLAPAAAQEGAAPKPPPGMVYIPGGTFVMGREVPEGEKPKNDTPAHPVTLRAFFLDRYEVTNARFARFIDAGGYGKPEWWSEEGRKWLAAGTRRLPLEWESRKAAAGEKFGNLPVVGVSWFEAEAFAAFEGRRLPTEAEWERAARGPEARVYPWGEKFESGFVEGALLLNQGPVAVGGNPADVVPEGVFDLGGNVAEWTSSWFAGYPGTKFASRYWGEDAERRYKVARGGSWRALASGRRLAERDFRTTRRLWEYPHENGYPFIGLRLAQDAEPPAPAK